jgi:hypothetical protein
MRRSLFYPLHQSYHFNQRCERVTIFCIWSSASLPNMPVEIQYKNYSQES